VAARVAIALRESVWPGHVVAQFVGDGVVGGALEGRLAAAWVPGRPWCPRLLVFGSLPRRWYFLGLVRGPLQEVAHPLAVPRVRRAPAVGGRCAPLLRRRRARSNNNFLGRRQ
jgi:hypothetical protein